MATRRLIIQGIASSRTWTSLPTSWTTRSIAPLLSTSYTSTPTRALTYAPKLYASAVPNPNAGAEAVHPKDAVPPATPDTEDPDQDSARHAAFLGEGDSNDGHDAVQEAYGDPPPSLDASNAAYLGEADSDDGFEHRKDIEGREGPPVDATHSAFLGEGDSDDGFEARRVTYPEEADHGIQDTSGSALHGQTGEADDFDDHDHKKK